MIFYVDSFGFLFANIWWYSPQTCFTLKDLESISKQWSKQGYYFDTKSLSAISLHFGHFTVLQ